MGYWQRDIFCYDMPERSIPNPTPQTDTMPKNKKRGQQRVQGLRRLLCMNCEYVDETRTSLGFNFKNGNRSRSKIAHHLRNYAKDPNYMKKKGLAVLPEINKKTEVSVRREALLVMANGVNQVLTVKHIREIIQKNRRGRGVSPKRTSQIIEGALEAFVRIPRFKQTRIAA